MSSTTNPTTASLSERVYWAISQDTPIGVNGPIEVAHDHPEPLSTEPELDLVDWGVAYGIAYALATLDADPFTPVGQTAKRAGEAAREAVARWTAIPGAEVR